MAIDHFEGPHAHNTKCNCLRCFYVDFLAIALVSLTFLLSPPAVEHARVAQACKDVGPGASFAQMTTALHNKSSFSHEQADFQKHEYLYSGRSGSCTIVLNNDDTLVLQVRFDPLSTLAYSGSSVDAP